MAKTLSVGEETLALHFRAHGLTPEREYVFAHPRRYRFDFCFPDEMLAIEVDGGTWNGKGRHSHGTGYVNDCQKFNLAVCMGWRVLRFTTGMVTSGEAIDVIRRALGMKV